MKKLNRHSIRLKGYDYCSDGLYFITICTQGRVHLFGDIYDDKMILNESGQSVYQCWCDIPRHFPNVILHDFVIMPNHVHGIIQISVPTNIQCCRGEKFFAPSPEPGDKNKQTLQLNGTSQTIGSIIRGFKVGVTSIIRQLYPQMVVWQRNYYEHIIRNQRSYENIIEYIRNNPERWGRDCFNVES